MNRCENKWFQSFLAILLLCFTTRVTGLLLVQTDEVLPPGIAPPDVDGSGLETSLEECFSEFVGYERTFLRGVKERNFISYNQSSFEDCKEYCCTERKFNCTSFSYFAPLRVCYVMNLTKYDDQVQLQTFSGWTHYHKIFLIDTTTALPESSSASEFDETNKNTTNSSPNDGSSKSSFFLIHTMEKVHPPMKEESTTGTSPDAPSSTKEVASVDNLLTEMDNSRNLETTVSTPSVQESSASNEITSSGDEDSTDSNSTSKAQFSGLELGNKSSSEQDLTNPNPIDGVQLPDSTVAPTKDNLLNSSNSTKEENPNDMEGNPKQLKLATNVKFGCAEMCKNGGRCRYPETFVIQEEANTEVSMCQCESGFSGNYCEIVENTSQSTGLPTHIVAVAVVGLIIFLLFATLLIVVIVYRHKTGKYRVKIGWEKWNRKKKNNRPRRSESFVTDSTKPPFSDKASEFDTLQSVRSQTSLTPV